MKNFERMITGELYRPDEQCRAAMRRAQTLLRQYNATTELEGERRRTLLAELFGEVGKDAWIEPTFHCDYGLNILIGDGFYANYDCIMLDCAPIIIGSRVMLGPRVCMYTAGHPTDAAIRREGLEFAKSITIGDDVWIGGNCVLLPGVKIGSRSVIAAGSVVTKDIPADVVAGGSPCKVMREITNEDALIWGRQKASYEKAMEK